MLYFSGVILSFFLAFVLLSKKNKSPGDIILLAWLAGTGFHLLTFYLFFTGQYLQYPTLVALGFPMPLAHGPFLYLYTRQQTTAGRFRSSSLLHFIPLLLSFLLFSKFYILPEAEQVNVFLQKGHPYERTTLINMLAIYVSGVLYIGLSLKQLMSYKRSIINQFSNTEKINFNWLLLLIAWLVVIWIFVLLDVGDQWIYGAASLFVLCLGYFGIRQTQVFSREAAHFNPLTDNSANSLASVLIESSAVKYQKSTLNDAEADLIHSRLKSLMEEQKPFKSPELTLNELAGKLEIHPNHLSQVINSKENKNFYDLVNQHRVDEFIGLISEPSNEQYTLLGLALDCGFNSKASFNRNFKKYTGQTPSDFLKQKGIRPN